LFNKSKSPAPSQPSRADNGSSIPSLPDLPTPGGSTAAPARSAAVPSQRGLSTLSSDLQFEGSISGDGDLQIDGAIKGDVRVGRLIVGETGAFEGNISADYVEVRGRVVGGISGKQVKLIATAYVDGDITAEQMSIDIGAYLQGRVVQGRREAATPTQRPAAPEPAPQIIDMNGPA
tara:strand:- start:955 stop:1482 length:528 start_codon:yes stop_codon:yes gene_type:complete